MASLSAPTMLLNALPLSVIHIVALGVSNSFLPSGAPLHQRQVLVVQLVIVGVFSSSLLKVFLLT